MMHSILCWDSILLSRFSVSLRFYLRMGFEQLDKEEEGSKISPGKMVRSDCFQRGRPTRLMIPLWPVMLKQQRSC